MNEDPANISRRLVALTLRRIDCRAELARLNTEAAALEGDAEQLLAQRNAVAGEMSRISETLQSITTFKRIR